jgi:hypothetical protein
MPPSKMHDLMTLGGILFKQETDLLLQRLRVNLGPAEREVLDEHNSRVFRKGYLMGYEEATVKSQELVNRITKTLIP